MLRYSFLLVFRPSRFVEIAAQEAIQHEFFSNKQFSDKYPDRVLPPQEIESFRNSARKQTSHIRRALFGGILTTFATMLLGGIGGIALACWIGSPSQLVVYGIQAVGAGIILGATLGEVGRRIDTWDGDTLPERINAWTFRASYVVGTALFMISFSWDAAS